MGEVYLARDTELDRKVAVKFLSEELSKDADKVNRFVQEAKAASLMNHPSTLFSGETGGNDRSCERTRELRDTETELLRSDIADFKARLLSKEPASHRHARKVPPGSHPLIRL